MIAGFGKFRMYVIACAAAAALVGALPMQAQVTDTRELQAYLAAITHPSAAERTNSLRGFLQAWPQSSLQADALEWLAWDTRLTDRAAAAAYARAVLVTDAANPLATAVVLDNLAQARGESTSNEAQHAIQRLAAMRPPAGMRAEEFYRVRQFATAALCSAVGTIQLQRKDYASAREFFRRAATLAPHDARYAYSLGLADLSGKKQNAEEGYLYLARAVNLAQGSAAASEIDQYARGRYEKAGGMAGDWNRFLAAAVVPGPPAGETTMLAAATPAHPEHAGIATPVGNPNATTAPAAVMDASLSPPKVTTRSTIVLPKISDLPPPKTAEPAIGDLGLPGPDEAHRVPFRPGAPVSLGILIESSLVSGYKRQIVNTLTDMVRHLAANEHNEAFVLSFGKEVAFRQDLTGNAKALEHALEKIPPGNGTALLDAVTLAAFQLNRVSQAGNNRVLLVISDGRNLDSRMAPLAAMSQLVTGAVRVYCIGLGSLAADGSLLESLASRTGGEARFLSDASTFRGTAHEMAARFGVDFPY